METREGMDVWIKRHPREEHYPEEDSWRNKVEHEMQMKWYHGASDPKTVASLF